MKVSIGDLFTRAGAAGLDHIDLNALGAAAFMVDVRTDGTMVYTGFNDAYGPLTGLDPRDMAGQTPGHCLPETLASTVARNYQACAQSGKLLEYEVLVELPGGKRWWRTILIPIRLHGRRVDRILGLISDVSQEHAARDGTAAGLDILQTVLGCSDEVVITLNADSTIRYVNRFGESYFGLTRVEMFGRALSEVCEPDVTAELACSMALARTEGRRRILLNRQRGADSWQHWIWETRPLLDSDLEIAGFQLTGLDVSSIVTAKAAAETRESLIDAMLDAAPTGIVMADSRGMIENFNAAAERLFRMKRAEALGRNLKILMPEPTAAQHDSYVQRYLAGGSPRVIGVGRDVVARRADGREFPINLAVGQFADQGAIKFVGVITDMSERAAYEQELRVALASLHAAEESKARFFGIMSHELRTPLNAVIGFSEVLLNSVGGIDSDKHREYLSHIRTAGLDLLSLISDILEYSKASQAYFQRSRTEFDIRLAIQHSIATAAERSPEVSIELQMDEAAHASAAVRGDEKALSNAMASVLCEFADRAATGGVIIVSVDLSRQYKRIKIRSADLARMPSEEDQFFEPYFHKQHYLTAGADTASAQRKGLRLPIAKRIIESHGGSVSAIRSQEGFVVDLALPVGSGDSDREMRD